MFECTGNLVSGRAKTRGCQGTTGEEEQWKSCRVSVNIDRWLWDRLNLSC